MKGVMKMRIVNVYSTYDRVAKLFGSFCFPSENDETAIRSFTYFLSKNVDIRKNDHSLFCLGSYDRVDGKVVGIDSGNNCFNRLIVHGQDIDLGDEK